MTRSRPHHRAARAAAVEASSAGPWPGVSAGAVAFILLLAVPRLVRMLWPQVWIEDESYLNGAFMLATGHAPYTTFALPHFPLLEAALAVLLKIFPASIRTAEAFTQLAAFTGSIFIWRIGRRLGGAWCGEAAALVFAVSPLVFRYHVFEREVFLVVPVLAATWLALRPARDPGTARRRACIEGLLIALALAIKLTALSYAAALFVFLLIARRRREAVIFAVTVIVLMATATGLCLAVFGSPFFVQVVLFRLVHAGFHSLTGQFGEFLHSQDVGFAAGVAGLMLVFRTHRTKPWMLPLLQLAFGVLLLVVLNPTFWAHDGIELLPWLALFSGVLVSDVAGSWSRERSEPPVSRATAAVMVAVAVGLLIFVTPPRHEGWGPGDASAYGFGYRDRSEIDRVAAFVRTHTRPGQMVAVPPILAFQANRPEVVVYPELAGTMMALEQETASQGWLQTWRQSPVGQRMFWDEVAASRDVWLPKLATAIQQHTAGAVINFSRDDLFPVPLIDVPDETLRQYGYAPALTTAHYEVWVPVGGV